MHSGARHTRHDYRLIGWCEWLDLPDLGIERIKAKVDTGARTSALHAEGIRTFERHGRLHVAFHIPGSDTPREALVSDLRTIRSSSGHAEKRCVIETSLRLGGHAWRAEITLTQREHMRYPMLLGRSAIAGPYLIHPARSFLGGRRAALTLP
jgi:hypothetical protein